MFFMPSWYSNYFIPFFVFYKNKFDHLHVFKGRISIQAWITNSKFIILNFDKNKMKNHPKLKQIFLNEICSKQCLPCESPNTISSIFHKEENNSFKSKMSCATISRNMINKVRHKRLNLRKMNLKHLLWK